MTKQRVPWGPDSRKHWFVIRGEPEGHWRGGADPQDRDELYW